MREFLQSIQVGEGPLPQEVLEAILEKHGQAVSRVRFEGMLEKQILAFRGRNTRAITALLDTEALSQSQDPEAAVIDALEEMKKESAYLFEQAQLPPFYASGTGTQPQGQQTGPTTLAEALRQRYEGK